VFCGEFIAEEVVRDKGYTQWLIYRHTLGDLFEHIPAVSFTDEAFSRKKQNLWSWDYSSQALDYQDFQIISRIEEILL
jgi:hypothetical protein